LGNAVLETSSITRIKEAKADSSDRRNDDPFSSAGMMLMPQPGQSIAPCLVSSRTSRRCAPVPHAASWTRPARGALPEDRSAPRNGPFDLTKECNLDLDADKRQSKPG
jgi:hypothetical protein